MKATEILVESRLGELHSEFADVYHKLAPKIQRHKDAASAEQLYQALKAVAVENNAVAIFKDMLNAARNAAHMDYDTNPGGFENWFWYLPFDDDITEGSSNFTSQFKTKQEAVQYAKEKVQSFRDPEDGIEVWAMPDSGFNVVHTMNYSGRESVIARGGRKLGTVGPRQQGVEPTEQAMDQSISDLVKDAMGTRPTSDWMQRWMAMSVDKKLALYQQLASQLD